MHVEDDPGQVADDKDEHNQHEDDGQVLVMSLPPSSPPSAKFNFNFFMFCFPLPRNMTFILTNNVTNKLLVQHYGMNSELNSVKLRQQLGLLPLRFAPFVLATS